MNKPNVDLNKTIKECESIRDDCFAIMSPNFRYGERAKAILREIHKSVHNSISVSKKGC